MILLSCSGGCFFAVKEVSLLDQGRLGKQRVSQLEQVTEACVSSYVLILHVPAIK